MLIKYKTSVINLDKVSEYVKSNTKGIRFFFDSFDHETNQVTCSELEFSSEEEREQALHAIKISYLTHLRFCELD